MDGFPVLTNGSVFTNNFTAIVYTNPSAVVYQSGSITSAVVQGTFASAGQLVFVVSTNLVNVTNPACLFFGQYQLNTGAPAWTNLNNSIQTLSQSGANFFFNTNGVPVFTATSLTGPWSAVGSASPVPLTVIGSYEYMTGPLFGYFNSTNLTAQMLAIAKLSTNGFGNSVTHSTNEFDLAGIGAAFAQAATNNLGALAFQGNNTTVSNAQFSFTSTSASNALYIVSSNGIILFGYKPATGSVVIADTNNFVRVGINALYSILFAPDGLTQFQIKNDEFKFFDHSGFNQLDLTSSSANFPANLNVGGDATLTNNLFVKGIAYGNFFGATNLQSTNIVGTKFALSNDVVSLNTFTTNATTTISNNVAQKANTNSPTLFTPILVNSTGNFKGSVTNGSANATTQSNMTLFSSVFASANSLNTLFYTTISGTEVLGSSAPIYGTLAGGSGSGLAQMTNLFNSLITAQTLTPNNVNTNEFINGVSQELMDYNTITLLNSSNTVNLVYRILTGGIWTNVGSGYGINIVAGQYQNVDNAGNILFFRNGSPQGQWSVNYISTNAPTGDWGRVIDFSGALKATGIPSNSIVTVNAGQVVGTLPPADLNGIVFNGSGITNLGTSGIVTLTGGTNKVTANFQTNVLMTYLSVDGTASQIFLKPSEWSASNYFTIRSSNSSDTNQVYWWLKP